MEASSPSSVRRTEDIALDLLKFIAAHANLGRTTPTSTPGFAPSSSPKLDDQVKTLLDLYGRCREAVEAPLQP